MRPRPTGTPEVERGRIEFVTPAFPRDQCWWSRCGQRSFLLLRSRALATHAGARNNADVLSGDDLPVHQTGA